MLLKETILDILLLYRRGLSLRHIARITGKNPRTIKKYIENPGNAGICIKTKNRISKLAAYTASIDQWLSEDPQYTSTWIYDHIQPQGYTGSYETVVRYVHELKKKQSQIAYLRFETSPGVQAQVDFGEFVVQRPDGDIETYYLFAMILGYSRNLYCEIIKRCDMSTFLDCHIRAFEYFGGVVQEVLYDRMRNVYIRELAGKVAFTQSLVSLALHCGFKPEVTPAYSPWVKGKIEKPIDYVRNNFWRGYQFSSLERTNIDLLNWLSVKAQRVHGTTHERVDERFTREKPYLAALPQQTFDTSYAVSRSVYKDCLVQFAGNRYMVPHQFVEKQVLLRVKDDTIRIFHNDQLLVTYTMAQGKGQTIADQSFINALRSDAEMNHRKYAGSTRKHKARAQQTISPSVPSFVVDVESRSVALYDVIGGNVFSHAFSNQVEAL